MEISLFISHATIYVSRYISLGVNNVSMSIDILDEQTPELDETFRIVLYNVSGRNERLRNGAVSHNFQFSKTH